jgi:hypothetical protein
MPDADQSQVVLMIENPGQYTVYYLDQAHDGDPRGIGEAPCSRFGPHFYLHIRF